MTDRVDGSYVWTCPGCGRQVPHKVQSCRCGFQRTALPEPAPSPPTAAPPVAREPRGPWTAVWAGVSVLLLAIVLLRPTSSPDETSTAAPAPAPAPAPVVEGRPDPSAIAAPAPSAPTVRPAEASPPPRDPPPPVRPTPVAVRSLEDVIGSAVRAVVSIEAGTGRGTGFFADRNTVVTNAHVVEGVRSVTLQTAAGSMRARVATVADDYDLAVLKIDRGSGNHEILPLGATTDVRVGQEVVAIGFALGLLENTVTRGIISAVRRVGGTTFLQTDAAINPGNSGGPLLDTSGRVVGITTLKFGAQAESLGFAVAADHAAPLLAGGRPLAPTTAETQQPAAARRLAPLLTPNQSSATNRTREEGTQTYEQHVTSIAQQSAQIDAYWDDFSTECLSDAPPGRHDRGWFSLYAGAASVGQRGARCAAWRADLKRMADDVNAAMTLAGEAARRAGVYPGVQRDLRRRYRMTWRGWGR
ncbi:MAG: hypothetical protein CL471_16970 [Acidobacteria bacterium]|nr:hypothetical protein [Acidobacteriota bacterium]